MKTQPAIIRTEICGNFIDKYFSMKITLADKFIAWLTLFSGLSISAVAVYYSVAGLISIFAAAVIPIAVMGIVLELSKLVATVWLKQNWFIAPRFIKAYLLIAVAILMVITSMGIFGYLSKAHMDQTLVSGDAQGKIAIYDEKIKIAKENIDANRKALKQMDEAVDQVMGRSTDEKGADKAVAIRRSQQKERGRLLSEIEAEQKKIVQLNEDRAPIAAEVRKVEAEVGPIKYIAAFLYGDNPDQNLLERAVRWVIIIIVVVFDPLAVILLLASQYSFQYFRKVREEDSTVPIYVADVGEKPTEEEKKEIDDLKDEYDFSKGTKGPILTDEVKITPETHPYLYKGDFHKRPEGMEPVGPIVGKPEEIENHIPDLPHPDTAEKGQKYRVIKSGLSTFYEFDGEKWIEGETINETQPEPVPEADPLEQWNKMIAEAEKAVEEEKKFKILPELQEHIDTVEERIARGESYIDAEGKEQPVLEDNLLKKAENRVKERIDALEEESKKKINYIVKENGTQVVKTKE
jgi:hypothetical protein